MQIAAVEKAVETAVTKEPGMAAEKMTEELAVPFAGLLDGLINLKLTEGGHQEQESENPQEETLLSSQNMTAFFPAGLNIQLVENDMPVTQGEGNAAPVCEMVPDNVQAPENNMLQPGIQNEMINGEELSVFPEVAKNLVSDQEVQTKQGQIDQSRQIPLDENTSSGQRTENIPLSGIEVSEKENTARGRKQESSESKGQKTPEIKVYESDGVVKAAKQHITVGKEEIPDREYIKTGPDTVKHRNQDTGTNTIIPGETGPLAKSQGMVTGQVGPRDKTPEIINQVVDKMKIMLSSKKSEISIQLKPESLGRLKLRLTVTDGVLDGRIIVQNSQTKNLILSNIERLQESLEQQGIPVNKFNVNVGGDSQYRQQQFFQDNRQTFRGRPELNPYQQNEDDEPEIWRGEGTIELLA